MPVRWVKNRQRRLRLDRLPRSDWIDPTRGFSKSLRSSRRASWPNSLLQWKGKGVTSPVLDILQRYVLAEQIHDHQDVERVGREDLR